MYKIRPNLILGFHGCDKETSDELINSTKDMKISKKPYDWLGTGMYFWENNLERAKQWASEKYKRGQIKEPAVVGAVIHLGHCCDFLDLEFTEELAMYYEVMKKSGIKLPKNDNVNSDPFNNKLLRKLDCSVIEYMHDEIWFKREVELKEYGYSETKNYDSVRCAFIEGGPAFPGAEIQLKNHIQICVRNPNCILGFFNPRTEVLFEGTPPALSHSLN